MRIIAAIGSNSSSKSQITKIILSGANTLMYKFSYRSIKKNIELIKKSQNIIYGLNSEANVLIDLPNNKMRLGTFPEAYYPVEEGQELTLKCATESKNCSDFIPLNCNRLDDKVIKRQIATIGDGAISIQIMDIVDKKTAKILVLNNGHIRFNRSLNNNYLHSEKKLLDKYEKIKQVIEPISPSYICVPYIDNNFSQQIKEFGFDSRPGTKIIAKIETELKMEEVEKICQDSFYSHIMIDRAELGVNMPFEKTAIYQKQILKIATKNKKRVIIASHILPSTMKNLTPSRADIADLTNIVLDEADGIAFTYTTAAGFRPAYSIKTAKSIIKETQKYKRKIGRKK